MEPFELTALSLSAILAGFSAGSPTESRVTTHMLPVIAGQWQLDLSTTAVKNGTVVKNEAISDSQESPRLSQQIYTATQQATSTLDMNQADILQIEERRHVSARKTETTGDKKSSQAIDKVIKNPEKQCRELYSFDSDNKVRVSSGKELTWGQYMVSYQEEGLPIIAMTTVFDNNEPDCSGNQIDQTGEAMVSYLDYKENFMQWCSDNKGVECHARFSRVFP